VEKNDPPPDGVHRSSRHSLRYITTDGQSASLGVRNPTGPHYQFSCSFHCRQTVAIFLSGVTSLARGLECSLQLLLVLVSVVFLGSEKNGTHDYILRSLIRHSSNLEDQVTVFTFPGNRAAHLFSWALGSLFVASYDSHCCCGGIRSAFTRGCTEALKNMWGRYPPHRYFPPYW
jgi:hypothetical protein